MSINQSQNTPENALQNTFKSVKKALQQLKTNQLKVLVIPNLSSDPGSSVEGQIWHNTTSHTTKIVQNGSIKTITTS